jgi:hypothetical protein
MRRAIWYTVAVLVTTLVATLVIATPADAATAIEYGLIAALISVAAISF